MQGTTVLNLLCCNESYPRITNLFVRLFSVNNMLVFVSGGYHTRWIETIILYYFIFAVSNELTWGVYSQGLPG